MCKKILFFTKFNSSRLLKIFVQENPCWRIFHVYVGVGWKVLFSAQKSSNLQPKKHTISATLKRRNEISLTRVQYFASSSAHGKKNLITICYPMSFAKFNLLFSRLFCLLLLSIHFFSYSFAWGVVFSVALVCKNLFT